jgi:hypothetical protein
MNERSQIDEKPKTKTLASEVSIHCTIELTRAVDLVEICFEHQAALNDFRQDVVDLRTHT